METYFMLDRRLLNPQGMENVELKITPPVKDEINNPLFTEDRPWEVRIDNGYPNVIYDEEEQIYRCYYTLFTFDPDSEGVTKEERRNRDYVPGPDRVTSLAYAESWDGIHWDKLSLGRVDWRGSKENNLIFLYAHGTGVMLDKREKDRSKRYKMVTKVDPPVGEIYMAVSFSEDGKNWQEPIPWQEHNPPADSHNLPFWNEKEGCYMVVSRVWRDGIRITTTSKSHDFIHWSEPKEALRGRGFENQIYAMPVFYWKNIYLGFASLIHEGDRLDKDFDTVDCELTWAADPEHFDFAAPGQYLISRGQGTYPDGEYDCSCIYASMPVVTPDGQMIFYYMGGNGKHTNYRETSLARAVWQQDRFAAMVPKNQETEALIPTTRLQFTGKELAAACEVIDLEKEVILQAAVSKTWNEEPVPGFGFEDSQGELGEDGKFHITFKGGLENLAGQKGCIRLRFKNLKLWTLEGDILMEGHRLWEGAREEELDRTIE